VLGGRRTGVVAAGGSAGNDGGEGGGSGVVVDDVDGRYRGAGGGDGLGSGGGHWGGGRFSRGGGSSGSWCRGGDSGGDCGGAGGAGAASGDVEWVRVLEGGCVRVERDLEAVGLVVASSGWNGPGVSTEGAFDGAYCPVSLGLDIIQGSGNLLAITSPSWRVEEVAPWRRVMVTFSVVVDSQVMSKVEPAATVWSWDGMEMGSKLAVWAETREARAKRPAEKKVECMMSEMKICGGGGGGEGGEEKIKEKETSELFSEFFVKERLVSREILDLGFFLGWKGGRRES
jgi:hypothetical protein